jgi:molybdopterin synthase sulfur carrier subunit
MHVTTHLYATLRQTAGQKSLTLELSQGSRVCDLLERVCVEKPALRAHLFDPEGKLFTHIHLFVNKRDITYLPDGLEHSLQAEDTLDIFPPVGGG